MKALPSASGLSWVLRGALALLPLSAFSWAAGWAHNDAQLNLATFDQVWTTVRDKHFDRELGGIDWEAIRDELRPEAQRARSKGELRGILNGMLQRLGQSHLSVLPGNAPPPGDDPFRLTPPAEQTWDTSCGFAVMLANGEARVASVHAGSAVAEAGVQEGWRVSRVGDNALPPRCLTTAAVTFPLLTAPGDSVGVGFIDPDGRTHDVEIALGTQRTRLYTFEGLPPIRPSIEYELLEPDIGYIAFDWFFDPTMLMTQFNRAMTSFKGTAGVIIDVRGNSGGMGAMALNMISWFAEPDGAHVGTMITRNAELRALTPSRPAPYTGPVAVLIDGSSGSAAEIFSAGMRSVGGARLFGQTTLGAVLPAAFERLPNGDSLLYALANYVTVTGNILEGVGVVPDRVTSRRRGSDPFEDEALQLAIDWILGNE